MLKFHFAHTCSINMTIPRNVVNIEHISKASNVNRVAVDKASLDLTGRYPNTNKGRTGFLDECN